jgi:predicted HicB family RNase H-like nuclease
MKNIIDIDGHKAVITFDRATGHYRGELAELNGGADFYAVTVEQLFVEGRKSLKVLLELCAEEGIDPCKLYGARLKVLRREIAEGLESGASERLDMAAIKREARKASNI